MGKNENKGGNPKAENRCPVCGRFVKKSVKLAYQSMLNEVERTQRDRIAQLSEDLARKNKECKELRGFREAYEELLGMYNEQCDEITKLKAENYRLEHLSIWERIFGR